MGESAIEFSKTECIWDIRCNCNMLCMFSGLGGGMSVLYPVFKCFSHKWYWFVKHRFVHQMLSGPS